MPNEKLSGMGDDPILLAPGRDLIVLVKVCYDRVEFFKKHFSVYGNLYKQESIDRIMRHANNTAYKQEAYAIGMYSC